MNGAKSGVPYARTFVIVFSGGHYAIAAERAS